MERKDPVAAPALDWEDEAKQWQRAYAGALETVKLLTALIYTEAYTRAGLRIDSEILNDAAQKLATDEAYLEIEPLKGRAGNDIAYAVTARQGKLPKNQGEG